jgi:hypothetical protein
MQIKLTPVRKRVFKLKIDIPYTYTDVLAELESITWRNPGEIARSGLDLWSEQRLKYYKLDDTVPKLLDVHNHLTSTEAKYQYIDTMLENVPEIAWEYDFDRQQLFDHTNLHAELTRDAPEFVNVLHTDFRLLVATGMVYLTEHDSDALCTVFYTSADRDEPLRMTTEFGSGWWHMNGNDTYHEGWNKSDKFRYSFLLGLTLNVVPRSHNQ